MNKQKILGILSSLFFANLVPVYAQEDIVSEWLRFIFVDLGSLAESGDQIFIIYAKVILFFLVFAVLYWSAQKIFPEKGRVAGTVAFIISLMSVILLPGEIIITIFNMYAVIIGYAFILLPVIVGLILAHKLATKGGGTSDTLKKALRGIIFIVIAILTFYLAAVMIAKGSDVYVEVARWVKVGGVICLLVGIFYLLTCWSGEGKGIKTD